MLAAPLGGGIFNEGTLTVTGSTLSGNLGFNGGGIENIYSGRLTVTDSTFGANTAAVGGGIDNYGPLVVSDSTFSDNFTNNDGLGYSTGGGIFNSGTLAIASITTSTFSGNSAKYGGGIFNGGAMTVTDASFGGNSARGLDSLGGGIYNFPGNSLFPRGTLKIRNTLIGGNSAPFGPDVSGPLTSLGHNLIGIGDGGGGYAATDMVGTATRPIDPMLGPLQDNGGPTWTMALLPGSPAIGAGGPSDSEWDQRGPGYARSVNGTTDLGAYQVQPSGAGAAALTLRLPEPIHPARVLALSGPSTPSIPLRPAAGAVDRVIASEPGGRHGFDGLPKGQTRWAGDMAILQSF